MTDHLLVTRRGGVVTATLNRPQARNALTYAMYDGLAALCHEIDAERETKVLVLTGAGGEAFAAGTDIAEFQALRTEADALAYEAMIERVLGALEGCRVPTIAALAGACTGGGAMIAACCDLRIAAPNLKFGVPIARTLGNCLSARNLVRLAALIGESRVKELLFTARLVGAAEARAIGLVADIAETADGLPEVITALCERVASHAPLTLRATKIAMARQRADPACADDLVIACYMSADFREGVAAFLARRPPDWAGK